MNKKNGAFRLRPRLGILLGALLFAGLETTLLHWLQPLEYRLQNVWLRWEAAGSRYDPDILLVNIDERSLQEMAPLVGRWPWPRSVYAELLEGVLPHNPRAVIFDIVISDRHVEHPDSDLYFVKTAVADPRVYMPMVRLRGADDSRGLRLAEHAEAMGFIRTPAAREDARAALILPLGRLATTGRIGAINFLADEDGVGRRYPLYQEVAGWRIPSLPMRLALAEGFPMPGERVFTLDWGGTDPAQRPAVSFVDLYRDATRAASDGLAAGMRGKILVLGSTAPELHDSLPTPFAAKHPGVDILATAISNLKNAEWISSWPAWSGLPLAWALIGLLGWVLLREKGQLIAGGLLVTVSLLAVLGGWVLVEAGQMAPLAVPLACGWLYYFVGGGYEFLHERRARQHAVRTFGRFLDPRVVADLVTADGGLPDTRGRAAEITVLFSDIRGFTTLSETRPPEEIVRLLNDYFTRQVEVIFRHGGTVDKFIGDAIMAFWGAPLADPQQAEHAVAAALEMAAVADAFRAEIGTGLGGFDIGIGIHSGPAVVGFLGSENRLDYTAIGDTVNLASRIEGQTKGRARILVSEATAERCGGRFEFVAHGAVQVKGRQQPVTLYEPKGKST